MAQWLARSAVNWKVSGSTPLESVYFYFKFLYLGRNIFSRRFTNVVGIDFNNDSNFQDVLELNE